MCHVLGDVTNQQSLHPTGMHTDPAVLQQQVAKPLNYAVNMSPVPQQMTPARPTFNPVNASTIYIWSHWSWRPYLYVYTHDKFIRFLRKVKKLTEIRGSPLHDKY